MKLGHSVLQSCFLFRGLSSVARSGRPSCDGCFVGIYAEWMILVTENFTVSYRKLVDEAFSISLSIMLLWWCGAEVPVIPYLPPTFLSLRGTLSGGRMLEGDDTWLLALSRPLSGATCYQSDIPVAREEKNCTRDCKTRQTDEVILK